MAGASLHINSFNAGELSGSLGSRFAVEKVASGCEVLENFLPQVHGPVSKRPGMEFMGYAGSQSVGPRLLEFNFSATTRFCIEFAPMVLRFWSNGAVVPMVAAVTHPYSAAESFEVQAKQVNDIVYLLHPNHPPQKLTRKADNEWILEPVFFRYPPLLDEYVEKESVATPNVTPVYTAEFEEAPEFSMQTVTAPHAECLIQRTGNATDPWLTLTWEWPSAPGPGIRLDKLLMQVQHPATGAWVTVGTAANSVTLSATAAAPVSMQYLFKPAVTTSSLVVLRKPVSAMAWGPVNAGIANFLPAGTTTATMPALKVRLVYDVAAFPLPLHRCTLTPSTAGSGAAITVALEPRIPEAHRVFTATYTLPVPVPASQVLAWQVLGTAGAWVSVWNGNETLTAAAPRAMRIRSTSATTVSLEYLHATPAVGWVSIGTALVAPAEAWQMRLFTHSTLAGQVALADGATAIHTRKIERCPSGPADAGKGGVTMPVGKFQVRSIVSEGVTIPGGAQVVLEKLAAGVWTALATWALDDGQVYEYDGTGATELTAPTLMRLRYTATSGLRMAAQGVFETVVYPPSSATKLTVNGTTGNGRTMTATAPIFQPGHVGSFWQVAHRRDVSYTEIIGAIGAFPSVKLQSKPIRIVGKWDLFTYGTWSGKLFLERKTPSNAWEIVRMWTSSSDRNVIAHGESEADADFRLRVADISGAAATGAAVPRFVLEAADSRTYGLVKVTGFTSATSVIVDVVRVLGDKTATTMWAEGAFSQVRGYPTAVTIHEGRLWFSATRYQPSTLWASVSNDYENFRRSSSDDGGFAVSLAAEAANYVRWLSSAGDAMLIGTGGEEWSVRSNIEGQPLTPTNVKAERRGAYSSAALPAKLVHDATLFIQRDGRHLRQVAMGSGAFSAADMTALAPHVTASGIRQIAVTQTPQVVLWAVCNDGRLISMTMEKEQNVFGWAQHPTLGKVRSVAVLMGTASDEVWLSVEREGRASIERMVPRTDEDIQRDWQKLPFADCSTVLVSNADVSTLAVPGHLNGKTLVGIADGAEFTAVASGGSVTLPAPAQRVVAGLPYTARMVVMDRELQLQDGTSQGKTKRISRLGVKVGASMACTVAAGVGQPDEVLPIVGDGEALCSGLYETMVTSSTGLHIKPVVKDSAPFPLTVEALVVRLDVYGG